MVKDIGTAWVYEGKLPCSDFITEEHGSSTEGASGHTSGGASSHFSVQGLGMGPGVPRCLRWPSGSGLQGLRLMSQAETQSLVAHIWQAQGQPDQPAAATASRHDPWVRLFWQVLSGALPAAALTHLQLLTASLLLALCPSTREPAAISKAADAGLAGGPAGQVGGRPGTGSESLVTTADVHTALDKLFPARPSYKLSKLKAAYSSGVAEQAVSYAALDTLLSPFALPCPPEVLAAAVAAEVEYGTALSRTADRYFAGKSANQTSRSSSETVQERSPNVDLAAGGQEPGARIDVATPAVRAALNENMAPPATAAIGNTPMESTTDISTGPVKVVATFTQPPDVTTTFNSAFVAASGCTPATAAAMVLQCGMTGTPGAGSNLLGQSNSSGQEALTTLAGSLLPSSPWIG
ncbi:uncharacterized protein HaLaN_05860 [Haematococcus lacustris]|uniref:Uncharacterized protein n=1 Tax=Haematococcus lacustris TaxID=44745 RepID=A0A699YKE7_HAELA|nr:uncharacterized protein HaLaN_05860 [Haematococcus lacustris]